MAAEGRPPGVFSDHYDVYLKPDFNGFSCATRLGLSC